MYLTQNPEQKALARPRQPRPNQGGKLPRVQTPPCPLRRAVVDRTLPPAFRALGRLVPLPTQFNFHLRSFDFPRAAKGWANLEEFRQFLIQRGWTEDWWTHRKPI